MAVKEEQYRMTLCIDLVYFLLKALLVSRSNKKDLAKTVLENWETRNKKLIKESFEKQATYIISKDEKLIDQKDVISILLSAEELVFNSIRKDFVKELTKGVIDSFD